MTIGTVLRPTDPGPGAPGNAVDEVIELASQAAAVGVRSVWLGQRFDYDAIGLAALVGRAVPQVRVGVSAVPTFARHPLVVAGQAQTAQAAMHGRFDLGVALGAKPLVEAAFGEVYERPIVRLREFLVALRDLTSTGSADLHGEIFTAAPPRSAAVAGGSPVPILVAAMAPQALRVTGELADGTITNLAGPRALQKHIVPALRRAAEESGRARPRVVAIVNAVVTDDVARARELAGGQLAAYDAIPSYRRAIELSGVSDVGELAVIGDEATVAAGLRRYLDAGATEVVVTSTDLLGARDRERTWRLLGDLATELAG